MSETAMHRSEEQDTLFELTTHRHPKVLEVDVSKIDIEGEDAFDEAEVREMADSIRRMGGFIHKPLLLKDGSRYGVLVGRRRCAGIKLLAQMDTKWQHVEMEVLTGSVSDADIAKMVLTENARRSQNILAELASINVLVKNDKMTPEGIAKSIGQNVAWVKKRLLLNRLPASLKTAMEEGSVGFGTAVAVAKLDKAQQSKVVEIYKAKKKERPNAVLSGADISEATSRSTVDLPQQLFEDVGSPARDELAGERLAAQIRAVKAEIEGALKSGDKAVAVMAAVERAVEKLNDIAAEVTRF